MMGLSSPGVIRRVAEIGQTEGSDADSLHAYCIRCHYVGWVRGCLGRPYSNGGDSSMVQDRLQGIVNVQGLMHLQLSRRKGRLSPGERPPCEAIVL